MQQEMPSRPQKSAKKDAERYSMFRSNHILVTLRWKDGLFPCNENVCLLLDVSWKMFEMVFKFSKLVKSMFKFRCFRAKKTAAQGAAYALRNRKGKQAFVKENEKKYSCKRNLNLQHS